MFNPGTFFLSMLEFITALFISSIALVCLYVVVLFVIDKLQKTHTIRHNYPVIGRFRYIFEHLGVFFRQYFFAMDREELPFNRAERSWVYRAAKNVDNTVAFGSTRDLTERGAIYFVNCMYPLLPEDVQRTELPPIGDKYVYSPQRCFNISGMSYGAISRPAILALSNGARKAGVWLNTGEGGVSPYHLEGGADLVYQIGTAKFGVRDEHGNLSDDRLRKIAAYENVKMIEIKLSQGAKPGKGGIMPGNKVTKEIAEIRGVPVGKDAISPPRFSEIKTAEEALVFINRVRDVCGKPTGIKMCVGHIDEFAQFCELIIKKGKDKAPDFIAVDSGTGGTGAAPLSLIDNVGMPINESLPKVVDCLKSFNLLDRVRVIAGGKLINPTDVAWAFCAGADYVTSARGFMFALGCIQALKCNQNDCPTGIATHSKTLQKGLDPTDKAERVASYARNLILEVETIARSCGVSRPPQLERKHARMVVDSGRSIGLDELYSTYYEHNVKSA